MEGRAAKPVLREGLCGRCAVCLGGCPARVLGDLAGETGTQRGRLAGGPAQGRAAGLPPCRAACPLGQDIPAYLAALAQGDQAGALEIILADNPLPSVLGHVCHHPCQQACAAAPVQAPPAIRELKRYAALAPRPPARPPRGEPRGRTSIIGSGPAGLATAWVLAGAGLEVEVLEAEAVAGGMLAWAIPPFRLPRQALQTDLDYLTSCGVRLVTGRRVTAGEVRGMLGQGRAVVLACGAPRARRVDLPGADLSGVHWGLDFLKACALGPVPELREPVVVVGGGNVALDAARWALRLVGRVALVYRRDLEQMPAYAEEVAQARQEGLELVFRAQPLAVEGQGRAERLVYAPTAPVAPGTDGRPEFAPLAGQRGSLAAASVILALGQQSEAGHWSRGLGLTGLTPDLDGRLAPGLYVAGDLVSGPATVVEAMAGGLRAARAILEELS